MVKKEHVSGLLVSFIFAGIALVMGAWFPLIGSSVMAILLGILWRQLGRVRKRDEVGLQYAGKYLLQAAIIFLGFTLSIQKVSQVGLQSLGLSLVTISVAFLVAALMGRVLGLSRHLRILLGFGTAICGGSAIAAASPILQADDDEIALSMTTIFLFNIVAVFLFPLVGHWLHLSDSDFGVWAGTAVNDTSSVVATAYSYSDKAGDMATIVKLARAMMIVPSCLILTCIEIFRAKQSQQTFKISSVMPWFILWFLLASILTSVFPVVNALAPLAKHLSQWLMAMALFGIGSKVSLAQFKKAGARPILTGLVTWFVVSLVSLYMILQKG